MGANAQTAVPAFTAGQVLTAEQQTQINTGIPVFATTTTRDAAFGGTGEKTLAEGQFAYIEATNTTQYYDGSSWQTVGQTPGLTYLTGASFSAATSVSLPNSTFTSTYENYRFFLTLTALTADSTFSIRMRSGGNDNSASEYITSFGGPTTASTFIYFVNNTGTSFPVGNADNGVIRYTIVLDVLRPFTTAGVKYIQGQATFINDGLNYQITINGGGGLGNATQYDSLSFISSTASSMTGTYKVYGYSNS
jgi:hypothetical protein